MSTSTYLQSRVEPSGLAAGLAVGDVLAIGSFVALGRLQHFGTPIGEPVNFLETLGPFLLGWVVAALLGSLYTSDAVSFPRRAVSWTLPAWVVTVAIAMLVRSRPEVAGGTAPTFIAVTLVVGGGLVVGWRVLAAVVTRRIA